MTHLRIASIVEGDGEVEAVPVLLRRIGSEILADSFVESLRPIPKPRASLVRNVDATLENAVELAVGKLRQSPVDGAVDAVLVLIDADDDPACRIGPEILAKARSQRSDIEIRCVLAVPEFETWFVAAAESLSKHLDRTGEAPPDPETARSKKKWIRERIRGGPYRETIHQAKLTAAMDLALCRRRSPSFDKLCRDLESLVPGSRTPD